MLKSKIKKVRQFFCYFVIPLTALFTISFRRKRSFLKGFYCPKVLRVLKETQHSQAKALPLIDPLLFNGTESANCLLVSFFLWVLHFLYNQFPICQITCLQIFQHYAFLLSSKLNFNLNFPEKIIKIKIQRNIFKLFY